MTAKMTKRQATALWGKLREHFVNAEDVIREIVDTRAWEPLGYKTFAEAWKATLSDVTLGVEIRPHVVYQMLGEGWSAEEVATAVRGLSPDGVESLERQRSNGVPADKAIVRRHLRKRPGPVGVMRLNFGPTMLREFRRIAAEIGTTAEEIAAEAVNARFREIVKGATPREKTG